MAFLLTPHRSRGGGRVQEYRGDQPGWCRCDHTVETHYIAWIATGLGLPAAGGASAELIAGRESDWVLTGSMRLQGGYRYHQYQVVGRHLPTEKEPEPTIYRMKLWATDPVRAKSKFW